MTETNGLILDPDVERWIERVADAPGDVLILGPRGSGKTEVARRIHAWSRRKSGPFKAQDCAAMPETLAESALFGHVRGAFTGADRPAEGAVAAAHGGTLFLDEIGELPPAVQAKLLTLLQSRTYSPVGSAETSKADFRLIAATNRDLVDLCNRGLFRADLHDRINVFSIALPPLRNSPERALRIAEAELAKLPPPVLDREEVLAAVDRLSRHPLAWPGNIRELGNFVKRSYLGVAEAERSMAEGWMRQRDAGSDERLLPFAPVSKGALADRERLAGLIHQCHPPGTRPKAAGTRENTLLLASRLLDALPGGVPLDEVKDLLKVRDHRSLLDNVKTLVSWGLVERKGAEIVALWPPASSTLLGHHDGAWVPAGPGAILSLAHGDRVRIELTAKCAGTLAVAIVTHGLGGSSMPATIVEGKDLHASKMTPIEIELVGDCGLEQILVHVGPPAARGGRLVEPMRAEGMMPDFQALELGRRMVLERWKEGWLAEHLVFHARGK